MRLRRVRSTRQKPVRFLHRLGAAQREATGDDQLDVVGHERAGTYRILLRLVSIPDVTLSEALRIF
jgi:hypothetical protein